ncbi:unnamed protein product [Prorocentrum cordatum]|uniref:RING-type domain-containing protein n=1 Tax=Prorocentrum cordatum TaxID=2364126 RepID=A0ABN9VCE6_9DINO|nr:unnamed protein product [Polarella glacialis]
MATTLDTDIIQVLVDYPDDPKLTWHHRLLLYELGPGRWVCATPDFLVQVLDLTGHRVLPLACAGTCWFDPLTLDQREDLFLRGGQLARVLGHQPAAGAVGAAADRHWRVSDTGHERFNEVIADGGMIGDRAVGRGEPQLGRRQVGQADAVTALNSTFASRVGRPLQPRRPRPTKQVATSAQQSILGRVTERVDDQRWASSALAPTDFWLILGGALNDAPGKVEVDGPPPRPCVDPRLRRSRRLLKELTTTLHRGNLAGFRRSVKAFISLFTVIKKYPATPGAASALDLSDEDGFYQMCFKVMSDWFGVDCRMTAAEAGMTEVFDVAGGKGTWLPVAAEAARPCFCDVPMGWARALYICHSALTDAMVESLVRAMRCDSALAEAQLLRDGRPAPRLAKGKPVAAPYVDNGNLLCFDREDVSIFHESMATVLCESGFTLRGNVECDPNLDMVGFEFQGEVMRIALGHLVNSFMLARQALSVLSKLRGCAILTGVVGERELRDVCQRRERWRFADAEVENSVWLGANAGDRPARRAARVSNPAPVEAKMAVEAGPPRPQATGIAPALPDSMAALGRWQRLLLGARQRREAIHMKEARIAMTGLYHAARDPASHGGAALSLGDVLSEVAATERSRAGNPALQVICRRAAVVELGAEVKWARRYVETRLGLAAGGARAAGAGVANSAGPKGSEGSRAGLGRADFAVKVLKACRKSGVSASLENPASSRLLKYPPLASMFNKMRCESIEYHCCRYGAPYKKPAGFIANLPELKIIGRKCACKVPHEIFEGKVKALGGAGTHVWKWQIFLAAAYPRGLRRVAAEGLERGALGRSALRRDGEPLLDPRWEGELAAAARVAQPEPLAAPTCTRRFATGWERAAGRQLCGDSAERRRLALRSLGWAAGEPGELLGARQRRSSHRRAVAKEVVATPGQESYLKQRSVGPATLRVYQRECDDLTARWKAQHPVVETPEARDKALESYLDKLYFDGEPSSRANNAIHALMFHIDEVWAKSPHFPRTRRALRGFCKALQARSRDGGPWEAALALARWMGEQRSLVMVNSAALTLVLFDRYLRASEGLGLGRDQLTPPQCARGGRRCWAAMICTEEEGRPTKSGDFDDAVIFGETSEIRRPFLSMELSVLHRATADGELAFAGLAPAGFERISHRGVEELKFGSLQRAELVAELAGAASERRREGGASTPAAAPAAAAEAAPRPCTVDRGGSSCSGSRAPGPPPERRDAGVQCDADSVATEPRGDPLSSRQGFDLLAGLLDSPGAAARQSLLLRLQGEELGAVEAELEASLRLVRRERHERLERQLRSAERRHAEECRGRQNLEEEQMCVVCAEAAKTTLFMPCRHLCTCEACGAQLDACPICRADIRERVKCIQP